ncbi:DNA-directed DNA polymerase [Caerostris extrusa]|uniref:DNA-directed DNA polymerase n=1 Tax=Caerostris extrusa TaxID=172846 RepID=A0AAV4RQG2_CAEEX|nr:DNA-directed DNA polymerase [Caerostris extrusa]
MFHWIDCEKKSIFSIPTDDDNLCCAKAIVFALAHVKKDSTAMEAMRKHNRPALKKCSRVTRSCRRSFGAMYFPRTCENFCAWLFTPEHKGFTAIAHNMKGFDGQFIMAWILKQGMTPDVIPNRGLIMSILHPSLKI